MISAAVTVPLAAQLVTLPPEVVSSTRAKLGSQQATVEVINFDADALRTAPTTTLDGALRAVPGFSLFRRSDSLIANPTAQGVSLRGLGPSGASRSLVLLDGVPLNDPFGGWVLWSQAPREGLDRIELVPGGGASAWGNAALGGVVQILTEPVQSRRAYPPLPGWYGPQWERGLHGVAAASFGDYGTRSFEFLATQPVGKGDLQLLGRDFSTDGFSLVAPERRGTIDVDAWSRHRWLELRWRTPIGDKLELTTTVRTFEEFRGNGTPYQRNGTREKFISTSLAGSTSRVFAWNASVYGQDQSFASTFSSVNATRTVETPASDQFAVPAVAWGAAWTGTWKHPDLSDARGGATSAGVDTRYVRGETKENFTFTAGNFTRLRVAGGRQIVAGLFALHEQPLTSEWRLTLGARLDRWNDDDGHRRETDRSVGTVFRDDHYASLAGTQYSPSVGFVWVPKTGKPEQGKMWRIRGSAQQAFRRPTLNELYRPFRQGANVTEANPGLKTERVTTGEVGVEWTPFGSGKGPGYDPFHGFPTRAEPPKVKLAATAFWNDLRDAVGNVTIARGPGTFPVVGTLAAGGLGLQRLNLDRTRTQGIELSGELSPSHELSFNAAVLFNDATVRSAAVAPTLVGKQIAQVPRHSATVGANWKMAKFTVIPRVRWIGRQFEDDQNTLILGEAVVTDVGVDYAVNRTLSLFLNAENLGNARVETGRSVDGIVNVGTPRLVLGGIRGKW